MWRIRAKLGLLKHHGDEALYVLDLLPSIWLSLTAHYMDDGYFYDYPFDSSCVSIRAVSCACFSFLALALSI